MTLLSWTYGFLVSLLLGTIVSTIFIKLIRHFKDLKNIEKDKLDSKHRIGGFFIGIIERIFFTVCTAFNLSGLVIGIIGWLTIKMASNHNLLNGQERTSESRNLALSALLGGLISMLFAILGGLIARESIKINDCLNLTYWFN